MDDFFKIIYLEKNTLIKGWFIATLLILPFTFIPTIAAYGLSLDALQYRLPYSILYALGFAMLVSIAALVHNFMRLVDRKKIFDKAAFKELDFHGRIDGVGSIVREMETFLIGKIEHYYFRLNLVKTISKNNVVEIVPLIKIKSDQDLVYYLKSQHGFKEHYFFGKEIPLSDTELENKDSIKQILLEMEAILISQNARPLALNEREFFD